MSSSSDNNESDKDESKYIFSTPKGHNLACRVLQPQLPYDPHDTQLEGICKAIDGVDIMVLTPTGSGKTRYFTMYMLLMLSLAAKPELIQPSMKKVPPNPVMVIVFPTNGVEEEIVCKNQPIVTEAAILT
jgi:superfamily II DNA/RNA helicase